MSADDLLTGHVGHNLSGKLHLDSLVGVGGMASVYAATHRNGRRYAVKILHPHLSANPKLRKRFLREARLANTVQHSAAVAVYDDGFDQKCGAYLTMDLLEGDPLDVVLDARGGKMPQAEALHIAHCLLDVLRAAHEAGLVHRDLKPANLFITKTGELKVLDFGIARMLEDTDAESLQTENGMVMGTPAFMSPEQARGDRDLVDRRSDLYGVGAILWASLTGLSIREGVASDRLILNAMTTPVPSIGEVIPELPPRLSAVIDRALAFEPDDRWANAAAMSSALSAAVQPTQAGGADEGFSLPPASITRPGAMWHVGRGGTAAPVSGTSAPIIREKEEEEELPELALPIRRRGRTALVVAVLAAALGAAIVVVTIVDDGTSDGEGVEALAEPESAGVAEPESGVPTEPESAVSAKSEAAVLAEPLVAAEQPPQADGRDGRDADAHDDVLVKGTKRTSAKKPQVSAPRKTTRPARRRKVPTSTPTAAFRKSTPKPAPKPAPKTPPTEPTKSEAPSAAPSSASKVSPFDRRL